MKKEDVLERALKYCDEQLAEEPYFDYDGAGVRDLWPGDYHAPRSLLSRAHKHLLDIQAEYRGQYAKQDEEFKKNILNTVALEAAKELVRRIA